MRWENEERAYLLDLRLKRLAKARKKDPKAFDAFWKATYERLLPGR
jgi:cephalosporin-C deacetylase-like acetyl esterase